MEGRTRIYLIEPGAETQDEFGEVSTGAIQHPRFALRTDAGGRRTGGTEALGLTLGQYEREYEVRDVGLDITQEWLLQDRDDNDRVFGIESVIAAPGRQRKVILGVKSRA